MNSRWKLVTLKMPTSQPHALEKFGWSLGLNLAQMLGNQQSWSRHSTVWKVRVRHFATTLLTAWIIWIHTLPCWSRSLDDDMRLTLGWTWVLCVCLGLWQQCFGHAPCCWGCSPLHQQILSDEAWLHWGSRHIYLGVTIKKMHLLNGVEAWASSPSKYVWASIDMVTKYLTNLGDKQWRCPRRLLIHLKEATSWS